MLEQRILSALKGQSDEALDLIKQIDRANFNINAVDGAERGFVWYALQWGVEYYIHQFIIIFRCPYDKPDNKGQYPKDFRNRLSEYRAERQRLDAVDEANRAYNERAEIIRQREIAAVAYEPGFIFTGNFELFYSSKHPDTKPEKNCPVHILVNPESNLSLQDFQAILEAHATYNHQSNSMKTTYREFNSSNTAVVLSGQNFLLVNIGLIITDRYYVKGGNHQRLFISAPVYIPEALRAQCEENVAVKKPLLNKDENRDAHSEEIFLDFLRQSAFLKFILMELFRQQGWEPGTLTGRKAYGIVFDMLSSQTVCNGCEKALADFSRLETGAIRGWLNSESDFKFILNKETNFKIIFRVADLRESSSSTYRRAPAISDKEPGNLLVRSYTHTKLLDLKRSGSPLILHGDVTVRNRLARWYNRDNYQRTLQLPMYSIFVKGAKTFYPQEKLPDSIEVSAGDKTTTVPQLMPKP